MEGSLTLAHYTVLYIGGYGYVDRGGVVVGGEKGDRRWRGGKHIAAAVVVVASRDKLPRGENRSVSGLDGEGRMLEEGGGGGGEGGGGVRSGRGGGEGR